MSTYSEYFGNPLKMPPAKAFQYPDACESDTPEVSETQTQPVQVPAVPNSADPVISKADVAAAFEKGRREGRRETEAQFADDVTRAIAAERSKINKAIDEFQESNAEYYARVEAELVHLAMSIAAKILHREAQVDPLLVAALVKVATNNLKQGSSVQVRVRPEEMSAWKKFFEQSENGHVAINLLGDPSLATGECTVHSEVGTAELGISAQLKEIERGLFDLLEQRPKNAQSLASIR